MNIFYLSRDTKKCAEMHVDKHVVKMILEYSQLLSTAHRVCDGVESIELSKSNRKVKRWKLNTAGEHILYAATHVNHPSAVWARASESNYKWLASLLKELCAEYTHRYGKVHKCERDGLVDFLNNNSPFDISDNEFTEPTPAMPEEFIIKNDSIQSYMNYYTGAKQRMFSWKNREVPSWALV